jgi:hypothetical protein
MNKLNDTTERSYHKIHIPSSREKSVFKETSFIRNRKMTFVEVVSLILCGINCSTDAALRRFFDKLGKDITMSQSAFSQARNKINYDLFKELFEDTGSHYCHNELTFRKLGNHKFKGRILSAIDGTQVKLPYTKKLHAYFGTSGQGDRAVTGRCSIKYDIINDTIMDACFDPFNIGEREQTIKMLSHRTVWKSAKELVIFDRGYYSFELVHLMSSRENTEFVMRLPTKRISAADEFGIGSHVISLSDKDGKSLQLRVVKFKLSTGEIETLVTNVFTKSWSLDDFKELYFLRWPVETKYDIVKNKIALENFSGLTVNAIYQDVFASLYLANVIAFAKFEADKQIKAARAHKDNKFEYQPNVNEIVGIFKDSFITACLEEDPDHRANIAMKIVKSATDYAVPIRPGRSIPRPARVRNMRFRHNQKHNC